MAAGAKPPAVADGTGSPPEIVALQKEPFGRVPDDAAVPESIRRAEAAPAALARHAFLTRLAASARFCRRSVGRALVEESLRVAGGERIDVLNEKASVGFYELFPHSRKLGFRLYPFHLSTED